MITPIRKGTNFSFNVYFNLGSNVDKKGRKQIKLKSIINNELASIDIGRKIEERYWDKKSADNGFAETAIIDSRSGAIKMDECKEIQNHINKILEWCKEYAERVNFSRPNETLLPFDKKTFVSFIKNKLHENEKPNAENFIEEYIQRRERNKTIKNGTISNHKYALKRIKEFCKERSCMLEWRIFNEDFEEDYRGWSNNLAKPYSSSTIGAQLSIMKTWLSDAEGKGFVTNKAFHKWKTKSRHDEEESDAIYLNEEEINKIYNLDLQSEEVKQKVAKNIDIKKLDEIRDLFIIGCKTGLRFSDWGLNLRHAIVVEGDIMKVFNQKTQKDVLIPLTPTLNEIIAKYGGFDKLPIPPIESTAIHRIQVLGKLAGLDDNIAINIKRGNSTIPKTVKKYEMIVTHTGRRSFVTNLIAKGATFSEIATATGHTEAYLIKRYNKLEKTEMSRKLQKYIS